MYTKSPTEENRFKFRSNSSNIMMSLLILTFSFMDDSHLMSLILPRSNSCSFVNFIVLSGLNHLILFSLNLIKLSITIFIVGNMISQFITPSCTSINVENRINHRINMWISKMKSLQLCLLIWFIRCSGITSYVIVLWWLSIIILPNVCYLFNLRYIVSSFVLWRIWCKY